MTLLAILLAISGFIGDWANNADALLTGSLEITIGTAGRICIALLFAGAVTVLGYASSHRKRYFFPAMAAVLGSACLTLYAQWGHVELRDAKASAEASRRPALEAERSDIQSALPACRLARWCDSQLKEARLREIDQQLMKTPATGNPGGEWAQELSYALLFSVSILLPFTNYGLSSFAGHMISKRKKKQEVNRVESRGKNVFEFKKKLLGMTHKISDGIKQWSKEMQKNRSRDQSSQAMTGSEGGERYEKAVKVVHDLIVEGKKPSISNVMAVRNGKNRVVSGQRGDIKEHLAKMVQHGILVAPKGKGSSYMPCPKRFPGFYERRA